MSRQNKPGNAPQNTNHPIVEQTIDQITKGAPSTISTLCGLSGTGKSSHYPALMARSLENNTTNSTKQPTDQGVRKVLVLQPHLLAATSLHAYMNGDDEKFRFENGTMRDRVFLWSEAGEQHRPRDVKKSVVLTYSTYASFLPAMVSEAEHQELRLQDYAVIFIDEIHERTLELDLVLLRLRTYMESRDKSANYVHIILTSFSNPELQRLQRFFDIIDGSCFVVPDNSNNRIPLNAKGYARADQASTIPEMYDVLITEQVDAAKERNELDSLKIVVFLPPYFSLRLRAICKEKFPTLRLFELSKKSQLSNPNTYNVMKDFGKGHPTIILTTFPMLSGVTIPDVTLVIITGVKQTEMLDRDYGEEVQTLVYLSFPEIWQQTRHSHQTKSGRAQFLFSLEDMRTAAKLKVPDAITGNCMAYITHLIRMFPGRYLNRRPQESDIRVLDFPPWDVAAEALARLQDAGCINRLQKGWALTSGEFTQPHVSAEVRNFCLQTQKTDSVPLKTMIVNLACVMTFPGVTVMKARDENTAMTKMQAEQIQWTGFTNPRKIGDAWNDVIQMQKANYDLSLIEAMSEWMFDRETFTEIRAFRTAMTDRATFEDVGRSNWTAEVSQDEEKTIHQRMLKVFRHRLVQITRIESMAKRAVGQHFASGKPVSVSIADTILETPGGDSHDLQDFYVIFMNISRISGDEYYIDNLWRVPADIVDEMRKELDEDLESLRHHYLVEGVLGSS
jgi:HrpA-like RNA helicase